MKLPLRVDFQMKLKDVSAALGGTITGDGEMLVSGVALDTRDIQKGDLFFALQASRDGHEYISDAIKKGACAAVIHRNVHVEGTFIRVKETTEALGRLARFVRRKWGGIVVAISGSNGKTTTKEMTAAVLSQSTKVLKAPGTWNNLLGVPLTLLLLQSVHKCAVLEMGMNDFGELATLCAIAEPNLAILTNVGPVHLEKLRSVEGVAKAKGELFGALKENGTAVVNIDDPWVKKLGEKVKGKKVTISQVSEADVSASIVERLETGKMVIQMQYGGEEITLQSPFIGEHNLSNLLCAFGAAHVLDVPLSKLQAGIDAAEKPQMRMEVIACDQDIQIINDCYNANPASTLVALKSTQELSRGRWIAVIGDMMELGDYAARAHRDIGIKAADYEAGMVYALGQFAGDVAQGAIQGGMDASRVTIAKDHADLARAIQQIVQSGDTILIKGSRGMKMEKITQVLTEELKGAVA